MSTSQLKWAMAHDWYIGHGHNVNNVLFVRVRNDVADGYSDFTNYQELRSWAGY